MTDPLDHLSLAWYLRDTCRPLIEPYMATPGCARAPLASADIACQSKADGSWVTELDHRLDRHISQMLSRHWPDIPLLSEEQDEAAQQALLEGNSSSCWVLDPLDGTTNFLHGIPLFSVSLALIREGRVVMGVIYDPGRDECFSAALDSGAFCNGERIHADQICTGLDKAIAMVDFKRLDKPLARQLSSHSPFYSQRNFGSVALEWCWLACGRAHVYIHGGQKLWDYAAGELIAREAGAVCHEFGPEAQASPVSVSLAPRAVLAAGSQALMQHLEQYWRSVKGEQGRNACGN